MYVHYMCIHTYLYDSVKRTRIEKYNQIHAHAHIHTHTLSFFLFLTYTYIYTNIYAPMYIIHVSMYICRTLSNAHTYTNTIAYTRTRTHTLSLFLSFSFFCTHMHICTNTHAHTHAHIRYIFVAYHSTQMCFHFLVALSVSSFGCAILFPLLLFSSYYFQCILLFFPLAHTKYHRVIFHESRYTHL